jgi:hypothetical protein
VRFEKIASRPADFGSSGFLDKCDVAVAAFGD